MFLLAIFVAALLYITVHGIYNAYFHPLSGFPGPKLWSTTFLFRHVTNIRGQLDWSIKSFHERYGMVVRVSPEELSFIGEPALRDVYGFKENPLVKDPQWYGIVKLGSDGATSIFNAGPTSHPRIRKSLAYAFSEKALRDQESSIAGYVDLFIEKLRHLAAAERAADMVQWYNFTTFDLIGNLAIGKSFGCLKDSHYHSWVSGIYEAIKIGPYIRTMATYTNVPRLMRILAPASVRNARLNHERYVQIHSQERMSKGVMEERKDFMSYILQRRGEEDGLSDQEITANCGFLVLAGSETTATTLSGVTYFLLANREKLDKVVKEIRTAFTMETEIDFASTSARLPYTLACFNESLRLYPPGPGGAPRMTPKGEVTTIAGVQTTVSVHALSTSHSPANFHLPAAFVPERWLPEATTDPNSPFFNDKRSASQPFSLGPRSCLGKSLAYNEMRVILARLLWNFDLELCAESVDWDDQITYTLWEKKPLVCRLREVRRS